jgi:serine/threonine-protein kinase
VEGTYALAGSVIAGYRVEAKIGEGGMGTVFRVRDERLDRDVALKVIAPRMGADPELRARFLRESRLAARVDHPHILPVLHAGESGDLLFIAMRLVSGGDVGSLVKRSGPLPASVAAGITSAVAAALDAVHAAGLVHRDVKPANMLLEPRPGLPHVYLSDFGISKALQGSARLSRTGGVLGTLAYSAPEQLGDGPLSGATDQYALACSVYEMLTGGPPFPHGNPAALMYAHVNMPPPPLPGLPAASAVMARALAKDPRDRFSSCGAFADALQYELGAWPQHLAASPQHFTPSPPGHPAGQQLYPTVPPGGVPRRAESGQVMGTLARSGMVLRKWLLRLWFLAIAAAVVGFGFFEYAGFTNPNSPPEPQYFIAIGLFITAGLSFLLAWVACIVHAFKEKDPLWGAGLIIGAFAWGGGILVGPLVYALAKLDKSSSPRRY